MPTYGIVIIAMCLLGVIALGIIIGIIQTRVRKVNAHIDEENHQLQIKCNNLNNTITELEANKLALEIANAKAQEMKSNLMQAIDQLQVQYKIAADETMRRVGEAAKQTSTNIDNFTKAMQTYLTNLDITYENKEKEFDNNVEKLEDAYVKEQERLEQEHAAAKVMCAQDFEKMKQDLAQEYESAKTQYAQDINVIKEELAKLKASKDAAMEAARREEEIKKQKEFYSLQISELDLNDIRTLEKIKPSLNKPRVLSMLIWTTWFQKPMTALCNNVLGTKIVTGIYKITNQLNGRCYVGQALDIADRWKSHAKCGLDIDTPAGNKLYAAMKADGIWNFTWELLETCSSQELNEKEKFYIDLYDSKNFGYNSTIGNK